MTQLEVQSRLWHIVDACRKILRYTAGKSIDDYLADDLIASGVERQLTIIGEAVTNIARVDSSTAGAIGDFPRIIAFRNQLVHNYPAIDHHAVWVIVQREVPLLLARASALLSPP